MIYSIDPANRKEANYPFVPSHSGLSGEQIDLIRSVGDGLNSTTVKVYGDDQSGVNASGSHFLRTPETEWVYSRMAQAVSDINAKHFGYDISGFYENFYYLRYDGGEGHRFNWHFDIGGQTPAPRKITLVLHLSAPEEYEGGELELMGAGVPIETPKVLGMITAFPAYTAHRVTPVTGGTRRVLVMFAAGPNFR